MNLRTVYQTIDKKALEEYNILEKQNKFSKKKNISDTEKKRLGFYHFVSNVLLGISDPTEIAENVIDDRYNSTIGEIEKDHGIDMIYKNDEIKEVQFIGFKYREEFKSDSRPSANDLTKSSRFFTMLEDDDLDLKTLTPKVRKKVEEIRNSSGYSYRFIYVSNEALDFLDAELQIKTLENLGVEVSSATLPKFEKHLFQNESVTNKLSFILPTKNVINLLLDDSFTKSTFVGIVDIENVVKLAILNNEIKKEFFNDNVRGYLGEKNTNNNNMIKTLYNNDPNFFFYNNGITVIAKSVELTKKDGSKNLNIDISEYSIVNGGQSLFTLCKYYLDCKSKNMDIFEYNVLVRIYQVTDKNISSKISEYTNSQTAISPKDLKSIDNIQIEIETYLRQHDVRYIRKVGDYFINSDNYNNSISLEVLAQLLYSKIDPSKISNNKKKLFESPIYESIFHPEMDFEQVLKDILYLELIRRNYNDSDYDVTLNKCFYVFYIVSSRKISSEKFTIKDIDCFETMISENGFANIINREILKKSFKKKVDEVLLD